MKGCIRTLWWDFSRPAWKWKEQTPMRSNVTGPIWAALAACLILLPGCGTNGADVPSGEASGAGGGDMRRETAGAGPARADRERAGPTLVEMLSDTVSLPERRSLAEVCRARVEERREECALLVEARAQDECRLRVEQSRAICDDLEGLGTAAMGVSCTASPTRSCAATQCTPSAPCDLGDIDGDGSNEMCLSGTACQNAGFVCRQGVLYTCRCTTSYTVSQQSCSCGCQW